jgi:hypothetical protein
MARTSATVHLRVKSPLSSPTRCTTARSTSSPCPTARTSPEMSEFEKWGHFSQMVWKSTIEVVCTTVDLLGERPLEMWMIPMSLHGSRCATTVLPGTMTANIEGMLRSQRGDPTVVISSGPKIATRKDALGTGGLDEVAFVLRQRILLMQRRICRHPTTSSATPYEGLCPARSMTVRSPRSLKCDSAHLSSRQRSNARCTHLFKASSYMVADAPVEYTVLLCRVLALLTETGNDREDLLLQRLQSDIAKGDS